MDKKSVEGETPVQLCNYTDVYYNDSITAATKFMSATATPVQITSFTLRRGDVLLTKDSESADDIAVPALVEEDLFGVLCGYHLALVRPDPDKVDPRFLFRALSTMYINRQFQVGATGVTRYGLRTDVIKDARIPLPTLKAQRQIADFLDRETQRIDALIDAKRRMIDLLQEKRSAIRNHLLVNLASTPQVPLKRQADITVGIVVQPARLYAREGVPAIRGLNVQEGEVNRRDLRFITEQANRAHSKSILREGDVVVVRTGQAGAAAVVPSWAIGGNCIDLLLVRPSASLDCRFLEYWLNSHLTAHQVEKFSVGAIQSHYNVGALRELLIGIPSLTQQRAIVRQLDQREGPITRAVSLLSTQISHLSEYRQALITKAVTGQLDEATLKGKKPADEVVRV